MTRREKVLERLRNIRNEPDLEGLGAEAAAVIVSLTEYGENMRQVTQHLSKRIEQLDPNAPRAEAAP